MVRVSSRRLNQLVAQVCEGAPVSVHERAALVVRNKLSPVLPTVTEEEARAVMAERAAKYDYERDKRVANADKKGGTYQYPRISDLAKTMPKFQKMIEDPYVNTPPRAGFKDDMEVFILGGGYGGLTAGARCVMGGVPSNKIRIMERGGDVGGTWYWNRYPGAMCDTESTVYMPLCEEVGYTPPHRYCYSREIMRHGQLIAEKYGLYESAAFATQLKAITWDDSIKRWIVTSDKDDRFTAKFAIINFGTFSHPKLPAAPGVENFEGHMWHTSRWDYDFTGGSNAGGLVKLADKRVGIIGTGATAIQSVPHLGEHAKHLYVFQRTPSTVDVRNQHEINDRFVQRFMSKPGWQAERIRNFVELTEGASNGKAVTKDLIQDGWTQNGAAAGRMEGDRAVATDAEKKVRTEKKELAELLHMERIRARIPSIVSDPETAEKLKPWYKLLCKRPTFHDDYLPTFNRPNVTLVDTDGQGVQGFTKKGIIANGIEYEVDCICLATGFETSFIFTIEDGQVQKKTTAHGFDIIGKGGLALVEKWKDGPRTYNSYHSRGFPNLFMLNAPQGPFAAVFTAGLDVAATHISHMIGRMRKEGKNTIEPTQQAEDAFCKRVFDESGSGQRFYGQCTPGYYNNEGHVTVHNTLAAPYPHAVPGGGGTAEFFEAREAEQAQNKAFDGFEVL